MNHLNQNSKAVRIAEIKNVIYKMVNQPDKLPKRKNSEYLSDKLKLDYAHMSNFFSEQEGTTIEHFIIVQKIKKVKQLLEEKKMSLTQIAFRLNYSSVGHLSYQFKKLTGFTPSFFKSHKNKKLFILPL